MAKQFYAGYNSYGINVVGYHAIHAFDTTSARDTWVSEANNEKPVAEAITAQQAYNAMPCLKSGEYTLKGTMVVDTNR